MKALILGIIFGLSLLAIQEKLNQYETEIFLAKVDQWSKTENGKEFAYCTFNKMIDKAMKTTFNDLHNPDFSVCTKENIKKLKKEYFQKNYVYFYEKVLYAFK